jgi:hypothetical protein
VKGNCAYGSVDGNDLSRQQLVGDVAGADHGGDSVLARYQGGMCGKAAAVCYHSGGAGEQRTLAITASLSASPAASSLSSTPSQIRHGLSASSTDLTRATFRGSVREVAPG